MRWHGVKKAHGVSGVMALAVMILASVCTANGAVAAQASGTPASRPAWRTDIAKVRAPGKGCFTATYPALEWQKAACVPAPPYPQPPRHGARPFTVGNGDDVSAQVPSGSHISTAIGSFDSVTGVTSESGPINNTGAPVANAYTLQLNTNFMGTGCAGSTNTSCRRWEQFIFENNGSTGRAFIQYWLIRYNTACPAGQHWNQFSFPNSTDVYCFKNNQLGAVSVPNQPITSLGQLSLSGSVSASSDSATMFAGNSAFTVTGDNAVNAAADWTIAEFNVVGDGGGGEATFNSGSAVTVRTRTIYGGRAAPTCVAQGFTGETNNLSFGPTSPAASQPGPAVEFSESSAGGAASDCAAATTIGDTHLRTFNGLLYDFQASGDFLLAQAKNFTVQSRQVSGAPTWPDAAVNQAVAAQVGKSRVAFCTAPSRLVINGHPAALADGHVRSLPAGTEILRRGNVYLVTGRSGDSLRAVMNGSWIDFSVGLGTWPEPVRGLLANANGNVGQLETSGGAVLNVPVPFAGLYGGYTKGWRVKPNASLLAPCGEKVRPGVPGKPFFSGDLPPDIRDRAQAICASTGLRGDALFGACTIDVAVLGKRAALAYRGMPAPVLDGNGDGNGK
jgi:hypothetical protein